MPISWFVSSSIQCLATTQCLTFYPVVDQWNVTFPKPKPEDARSPPPSGQEITVLHLSDWHVDPLYEVSMQKWSFCITGHGA
jgi:hypothetical protein